MTEAKALMTAAQDQTLNNMYHQTQILGGNQDTRCRMCKETNETVSHILTMYP